MKTKLVLPLIADALKGKEVTTIESEKDCIIIKFKPVTPKEEE